MLQAYERVAEFNTLTNCQRVYDVDRFGREVAKPMEWKPCKTTGDTKAKHSELWEDALLLVSNYRLDSRFVSNGVIQFRRYL